MCSCHLPVLAQADKVAISCQASPSKLFICDFLDSMDVFSKQQRKKINLIAKAKKASSGKPQAGRSGRPAPPRNTRDSSSSPPPLERIPGHAVPATTTSVGPSASRDLSESPPPLEPLFRTPAAASTSRPLPEPPSRDSSSSPPPLETMPARAPSGPTLQDVIGPFTPPFTFYPSAGPSSLDDVD